MTNEVAAAIYDRLLPGWREAPRNGANRRVKAPYREDEHPSLDVHESDLVWIDRATEEGGGAVDLWRAGAGLYSDRPSGEDGQVIRLPRQDGGARNRQSEVSHLWYGDGPNECHH